MLFGARLPGNSVFSRPAGRGFLVQANQAVLVQIPDEHPLRRDHRSL